MSTKIVPPLLPARAPCEPRKTSRTSLGKPTMAKTTSLCSATCLGPSAFPAFRDKLAACPTTRFLHLAWNDVSAYDEIMIPKLRVPIVLVHGLLGFDKIGVAGTTLANYFPGIPDLYAAVGNRVLIP